MFWTSHFALQDSSQPEVGDSVGNAHVHAGQLLEEFLDTESDITDVILINTSTSYKYVNVESNNLLGYASCWIQQLTATGVL